MPFETKEEQAGSVTIVRMSGRLTRAEGKERFEEKLQSLMAAGRRAILLDCREINDIDSGGVGALMRCVTTARTHGGQIKLLNLPPLVRAALQLLGFLKAVESFSDEATALASFP